MQGVLLSLVEVVLVVSVEEPELGFDWVQVLSVEELESDFGGTTQPDMYRLAADCPSLPQ